MELKSLYRIGGILLLMASLMGSSSTAGVVSGTTMVMLPVQLKGGAILWQEQTMVQPGTLASPWFSVRLPQNDFYRIWGVEWIVRADSAECQAPVALLRATLGAVQPSDFYSSIDVEFYPIGCKSRFQARLDHLNRVKASVPEPIRSVINGNVVGFRPIVEEYLETGWGGLKWIGLRSDIQPINAAPHEYWEMNSDLGDFYLTAHVHIPDSTRHITKTKLLEALASISLQSPKTKSPLEQKIKVLEPQ